MDFAKIKNFIKKHGDTFIILEEGEPEFVVMSYPDYEKLLTQNFERNLREEFAKHTIHVPVPQARAVDNFSPRGTTRSDTTDFVNEEFHETEFMGPGNVASPRHPLRLEDIRLEDLPI